MKPEDIDYITEAQGQIARRQDDLAMLNRYVDRLRGCQTVAALIETLVDRAQEINRTIEAGIERDRQLLDDYEQALKSEVITKAVLIKQPTTDAE
jgi:hypothetical protein